jgi:DDE superfamily endonuclease
MARVAPCFARRETRLTCRGMVNGLLSELDDYNCWTLAEAAGYPGPCRMQHLLSRARCDDRAMLDATADWMVEQLNGEHGGNSSDAILIVDETSDVKSSADCVGAARQYCGATGGIALCQVAVTLTYAAPAGHALIGRALYLPADWAADEERHELAGVPDEVMFATKPELAGQLPRQAHDRGIRASFTAVSLLAGAFLAAAAAWQRTRDGSTAALGLIPVTIPELLRQLRGTVIPWPCRDKAHREAWTLWRRRHQYQARQAHQRWHAYADELPQP